MIGLHVAGVNNVGSPGLLFETAELGRVVYPGDVIHHENPNVLDSGCGGLSNIAWPEYMVSIVLRKRVFQMTVFSVIRSSKRIVAMQARGEGNLCSVGDGFGGIVVPLIKMRHVGAHLFNTFNHHPIDFANMRTKQVALFETASQIPRNIGMSVEKFGLYPKITKSPQPGKLMNFSEGRSDDENGLDFSPARLRHKIFKIDPTQEGRTPRAPPITGVEPERRFTASIRRSQIRNPATESAARYMRNERYLPRPS
jgi:hypothetical protein